MFQATTHFSHIELVQLAMPFLGSLVMIVVMAVERVFVGRPKLTLHRFPSFAQSPAVVAPPLLQAGLASNDEVQALAA